MKISAITDIGKKRSSNQDSYYASDKWCIVADGMGGHNGGEVASQTAINIIKQSIKDIKEKNIERTLRRAIFEANTKLYEMAQGDPTLEGMGTTAVLCYFTEDKAIIAHVGDSRAYHITSEGIKQVTHDHSIVQQLIESGTITPLEAKTHPHKNLITRAIGTEKIIEVDVHEIDITKGDYILLCTDGLTAFVMDSEIKSVVTENDTDTAVQKLVELANNAGGADNITAIIIEI